jgi:hypothetical protein
MTRDTPAVCAVVPASDALQAALTAQTAAVEAVVRDDDVLRRGVRHAVEGPAQWLWVLDGSATPSPDALRRLLDALGAPLPAAPVLLASKVTAADGSLAESHAPWPRRGTTELAMAVAPHRLLPVRAARAGSVLVAREAAARTASPAGGLEGPAAAIEWTARLLRRDIGLLVTRSVCTARSAAPPAVQALSGDPHQDLQAGVAMLCGSGWYPKEKLWLGAEVAERAASSLRAGRSSPLSLARAAGRGWRARR